MDSGFFFGPRQLFKLLQFTLGRQVWSLLGWIAVMSLVYLLWLAPPIVIGKIITLLENQTNAETLSQLLFLALFLAGILILEACLRMAAKPALAAISFEASYKAKTIAFEQLLEHSVSWHDNEMTGSKIERVVNGGASVSTLLDLLNSSLLGTVITFASVLVTMSLYAWQYSLYGFCYLIIFWSIQVYFNRKERELYLSSKIASERATGAYAESAGNITTIKTLNLEKGVQENIITYEQTVRDSLTRQKQIAFRKYGYFRIFDAVSQAGFIAMAGIHVIEGAITLGVFSTLIAFFRSLDGAIRETVNFMDQLVQNWISVGRIAPLILESKCSDSGTHLFPSQWQEISLTEVSAQYPNGNRGIRNVSLSIRRGEHIGIIGSSGSGKSTIAKVLQGIIPLSHGSYRIDQLEFASISRGSRAQHISMVLQDSEMFNITLRQNITALREIAPAMVQQAAIIAELSPLIEKIPDGIDSLIGEKGYRLSGGERQRVGIARAACRNPDILILDEATSSLDSITESAINENLIKHLGERTVVIIAHRLSTIRAVDRVLVMEDGEIVESGSPQELFQQEGSRFKRLWDSQFGADVTALEQSANQ